MSATRVGIATAWLLAALCVQPAQAQSLFALQSNANWQAELRTQAAEAAERQEQAARAEGLLGCERYCGQLVSIFARLRSTTQQQFPDGAGQAWQLVVTRRPAEEAWALPDGRVFISEAFIRRQGLQREELAFALAHEIAHITLAHEADTIDIVRRLTPFGIGSSVRDVYAALDFDLGLLLRLSPMLEDMELEADQVGLMLAALAGFDPDRAIGLLRKFAAEGERKAVVATHPASARRLAAAEAVLPVARRLFERHRELAAQP
ncbi:MAG: M48 family metalloprotease [Rhodocyclaceae bacterium]